MKQAPQQAGDERAASPLSPPTTLLRPRGVFTTGPVMRHVTRMTLTVGGGLLAIFASDLFDLFFLAQLEDEAVTAAIGFVGPIQYFCSASGIGLAIATAALVSPPVGRGDRETARRLATNALVATLVVSSLFALFVFIIAPTALQWLGATGRSLALATSYIRTSIPSLPLLAMSMSTASMLRSVGDARRSALITLVGAVSFVAADAIAIFALGLGIVGAAQAAIFCRLLMCVAGFYCALRFHRLLRMPDARELMADVLPIARIAFPALLANIAFPISNGIVVAYLSPYGDGAVAGWAVMARVSLIAYCLLFAMTPAIGPILGQNHGIRDYARVRRTMIDAMRFAAIAVIGAWLVLAPAHPWVAAAFGASPDATRIIAAMSLYFPPMLTFLGALFVASATFNALGRAHYATLLNWGRATVGTIPFAILGGWAGGAIGVIAGTMLGTAVFGTLALSMAFRLVAGLEARTAARPA